MFTLRCTKRLLERIPVARRTRIPTTRLGDWYANLIYVDRRPIVLAVAQRTLLPVLVPRAPAETFTLRFRSCVAEVLHALHVPHDAIASEDRAMTDVHVDATDDRAIVGTLVDFARMLEMFDGEDRSLRTLTLDLAETLAAFSKGGAHGGRRSSCSPTRRRKGQADTSPSAVASR